MMNPVGYKASGRGAVIGWDDPVLLKDIVSSYSYRSIWHLLQDERSRFSSALAKC